MGGPALLSVGLLEPVQAGPVLAGVVFLGRAGSGAPGDDVLGQYGAQFIHDVRVLVAHIDHFLFVLG